MDIKTLKIETILKQKERILYGVMLKIFSENFGIKSVVAQLKDKDVEIQSSQKKYKTIIKEVDGYVSNTDPNILNIFFIVDNNFAEKLEIGDIVKIV